MVSEGSTQALGYNIMVAATYVESCSLHSGQESELREEEVTASYIPKDKLPGSHFMYLGPMSCLLPPPPSAPPSPSCCESIRELIYWLGQSLSDLISRNSLTDTPRSVLCKSLRNFSIKSSWQSILPQLNPSKSQNGRGACLRCTKPVFSAPWTVQAFSLFSDPHFWKTFITERWAFLYFSSL